MSDATTLWTVVDGPREGEKALGRDVREYVEWLRIMVGRSLALTQRYGEAWEYLAPGVPLESLVNVGDAEWPNRVRAAIDADFEVLRKSIDNARRAIEQVPGGDLTAFVTGFAPIAMVTLPTEAALWRVTDEGVSIVRWGLTPDKSNRRVLDWTPGMLEDMKRTLEDRVSRYAATVGGSSAVSASARPSRDVNAEAAAQSELQQQALASKRVDAAPVSRMDGQVTDAAPAIAQTGVSRKAMPRSLDWRRYLTMLAVGSVLISIGMLLGVIIGRSKPSRGFLDPKAGDGAVLSEKDGGLPAAATPSKDGERAASPDGARRSQSPTAGKTTATNGKDGKATTEKQREEPPVDGGDSDPSRSKPKGADSESATDPGTGGNDGRG
jgi:hypothetical protein